MTEDRKPDVIDWFGSKDGKKFRIYLGPEDTRAGVIKAWQEAGYGISCEEWFAPDDWVPPL